jgi:6-phosphogluconolactonase (cycloisomerase 2 family)
MARIAFRSSVGLLSVLFSTALLVFAGCGDEGNGGGGTGGRATGGAGGMGGTVGKGGTTGAGGTTGRGGAAGGAGGVGGAGGRRTGTGGSAVTDGGLDVPFATGGTGGSIDGGIDSPLDLDGGLDTSPIDTPPAAPLHVYVGCADSTGTIQIYSLNNATATLSPVSTFLASGPLSNAEWNDAQDRLYIAYANGLDAKLATLSRNASNGALTVVGSPVAVPYSPPGGGVDGGIDGGVDGGTPAPTTNAGPQTLTFDGTRKFLAVPNYFSGYIYLYRMANDGTVGALVSWHTAGKNAHHAVFTLNNDFMVVPYLGSDLIEVYQFDSTTGAITASGGAALAANTGPRHVALHANGKWLYSINEVAGGSGSASGTIDFLTVDQDAGTVSAVTTFEVPLPTGYIGVKKGSEIEISPAGDLLFVSMRLDGVAMGSLVSYRIDQDTGELTLIEQESSHGATPRQFTLSEDGKLLLVGNQDSDSIAVFRVDPATGDMTFVDDRDVCDSPRFVKLAAAK